MRKTIKQNLNLKILLVSSIIATMVLLAGCVQKPEELKPTPNITLTPTTQEAPSTKTSEAIAAPSQSYVKVSEKKTIKYRNHNITLFYESSSPDQILNIVVDGEESVVKIDPTVECPNHQCGYYWHNGNLSFSIRPIIWKTGEEGRITWLYSETWNTNDVYFEVSAIKSL